MPAMLSNATLQPPSLMAQFTAWLGATGEKRAASCGSASRGRCVRPTCNVAVQLRAAQQRGREMERAFSQYVAPHVIDRLMADPDGLSLGGETRDVTVLFADIRGFTALAEAMKDDPRRLMDLTSAILDPLTDIVLAHGGTIDKYMGDCVMAFWGAPLEDAKHAAHALEAGKAMLGAMGTVNRRLRERFAGDLDLPTIEIGVGINSGECIVGNLGSQKRFDYSVLGDAVNVASRLEGLCKTYGAPLLVGEETVRQLGARRGLVAIDHITLRGRREKLRVYAPA